LTTTEAVDRAARRPSLTTAGMVIWLGSEVMFFGGLFAAYFTLKENTEPWPGEGVHLNVALGALFTLVLVASSFTMHAAAGAAARHNVRGVVRWTAITILLGALFMGNQAYEWSSLEFTIASHPYGSLFYLMTGFHGLHVLGGMAAMALLIPFVRRAGRADHGTVESITYYWHFVDVVWIALFLVIFVVR
jgi:cytochrome c oxidase subunit 3